MNYKCKRCGYEWDSYREIPKACPYCKSYKWNVEPKKKVDTN